MKTETKETETKEVAEEKDALDILLDRIQAQDEKIKALTDKLINKAPGETEPNNSVAEETKVLQAEEERKLLEAKLKEKMKQRRLL